MKTRMIPFFTLLALVGGASADQVKMKDGSVIDGTVIRETADSYVLEVRITKSIRDERTVLKSKVERIVKADPSVAEYEAKIAPLVPVPDMTPESEYARRIALVGKFIVANPGGDKTRDAKGVKALLEQEANEIMKGGVKVKGQLVSEENYDRNKYNYDASGEEVKIMSLLGQGNVVQALREYDKMGRDFENTTAYCNLAPVMKSAAENYLGQVQALKESLPERMKKRETGLSQMSVSDRQRTQQALAEEAAEADARLEREKAADMEWITAVPNHEKSLDEALTAGKAALAEISRIPAIPKPDAGEAYRNVRALVLRHAPETEIRTALGEAKSAKIPDRYLAGVTSASKLKVSE